MARMLLAELNRKAAIKMDGIEILVMCERMAASGTVLKMVSSERQLADRMTKPQARQILADGLRCGRIQLFHDPDFVAVKKNARASPDTWPPHNGPTGLAAPLRPRRRLL